MEFDPDDEGVEAWEFSIPSAVSEPGERIPFDERPTVEIQMDVDRLRRGEEREGRVWIAVALCLVVFLAIVPGGAGMAVLGFVLAGVAAAVLGVLQVRRHQLREALEGELETRRREQLETAEEPAQRLAALRDELDRQEHRGRNWGQIGVGLLATIVTIGFGLAGSTQLLTALGGFFGLTTLLAVNEERLRTAEEAVLREQVRAIEEGRALPPVE